MTDIDDPTTQLNYQIAVMIADAFGRAIEDFDIELADQIIAKVQGGAQTEEAGLPTIRLTPILMQSVENYDLASEPYFELDAAEEEDPANAGIVAAYDHAAKELASMVVYEIDRNKQ